MADCKAIFVTPSPLAPATTSFPITTRHDLQPRVKRDSHRRPCVVGRARGKWPFVYSACTPPRLASPRLIPQAPSFLIFFLLFLCFLYFPYETGAPIWATCAQTPTPIFITISAIVINNLLIVKTQLALGSNTTYKAKRPSLFYNVYFFSIYSRRASDNHTRSRIRNVVRLTAPRLHLLCLILRHYYFILARQGQSRGEKIHCFLTRKTVRK